IYITWKPKGLTLTSHWAVKARQTPSADVDLTPQPIECRPSWPRRMVENATDNARASSKQLMAGSNTSWAFDNSRFAGRTTRPANGISSVWPPIYGACGLWWSFHDGGGPYWGCTQALI